MTELTCTVLVLGNGPGGYTAAIRAAQRGLDTIVVASGRPGGTCLNVGCIPSKALIHVADAYAEAVGFAGGSSPLGITVDAPRIDLAATMAWKDGVVERLTSGVTGLLQRAGVRTVEGWGQVQDGKTVLVDTDEGQLRIRAEHLVLAPGSQPTELRALPFGGNVISSTEALSLNEVPPRLAVIGAGYIGLELGMAFAKLGSEVTVVEAAGQILPTFEAIIVKPVQRRLEQLGVTVLTDARATGLDAGGALVIEREATSSVVPADQVLVAVGRVPRTEGWGLDALDLDRSGPFVRIDDRCRTSMHDVYAIGDLTGDPMLAHRAMAQGELVAEVIAGVDRSWDAVCVPSVVYTDPQIVSVGLSPDEARARGEDIIEGTFPFAGNGRSIASADHDGFVRTVARASDHVVIGIQAVGAETAELAAAFALAVEMQARVEDIAATIHAHPTRGEALQEAAMAATGQALHR